MTKQSMTHRTGEPCSVSLWAWGHFGERLLQARDKVVRPFHKKTGDWRTPPQGARTLFSPEGAELLAYFKELYEKCFKGWSRGRQLGSRLIVLYPSVYLEPRRHDSAGVFIEGWR
jgi:hypothetical protein